MEFKRKTHSQLEALDSFYFENNYPPQMDMENYAASLGLTYKQIQSWFVEKRRKEKRESDARVEENRCLQDLMTKEYILEKVSRKDGPPLGVEFDSLPETAAFYYKDHGSSQPSCKENQRASKRRKATKQAFLSCNDKDTPPIKYGMGKGFLNLYHDNDGRPIKYGMGKGLLTAWRATNPGAGDFPTGTAPATLANLNTGFSKSPRAPVRKPTTQRIIAERLQQKIQQKKKSSAIRREAKCCEPGNLQLLDNTKCELALEGPESQESFHQILMLMDDEELEGRESAAVPNPRGCSGHSTYSEHQDVQAKFPPTSVMMKQPFSMQPWESSLESVKKIFKIFHFLYTFSIEINVCPFTLDEFAQAFHDKDSLLLGKINMALLKLLLSDVDVELDNGSSPESNRSCNYLALLHSVEANEELSLDFWRRSLNPLTWTEIMCQVFSAAGFGSKQTTMQRETLDKETHLMVKYGLQPGSLKGELFKILLEQGNNGLKVSDLAKSFSIVDLKLASTTEEVECLICSMLSSDVSLFEKISLATYRLRINTLVKKVEEVLSDTEDCGSVDDEPNESDAYCSDQDSGCGSRGLSVGIVKNKTLRKSKKNVINVCTEIDESSPGESWLLGLMEGEYSDLSIDEKLDAMGALIDLLREGSSIKTEDRSKAAVEGFSNIGHSTSGGKIKRSSSAKHQSVMVPSSDILGQIQSVKEAYTHWKYHAIDSSASVTKFLERTPERERDIHPLQSVFLGSDRRRNRYWLFLGPCDRNDPGHRRIYFESSEDGHWEVIDSKEALQILLSVLDDRGKREALLLESLEKRQEYLREMMSDKTIGASLSRPTNSDQSELSSLQEDSFSPVSDVDNNMTMNGILLDSLPSSGAIVLGAGNKGEEKRQKWCRLQAFDSWIWTSFYLNLNSVKHGKKSYFDSLTRCDSCHDLFWRDEKHCRVCHTTFEIDFDQEERYAIHAATCKENETTDLFRKVLSSQLQALKAATYSIELVMPEDALVGAWTKCAHKLWVKRLRRTSTLQELMQALADFIGAINEDWLCQSDNVRGSYSGEEIIESFASLPRTTSALALWLVKLDALLAPCLAHRNIRRHTQK